MSDRDETRRSGPAARAALLIAGALALRYVAHSVMLLMALVAERRPAPSLPDAILSVIPRVELVERYNYHIWLLCYVPLAVAYGFRKLGPFLRFLVAGAIISLLRGVSILMTGLGPVHGPDINANASWSQVWSSWLHLINPVASLLSNDAHLHLTKDLFFSGHTATTFLLALYCYRDPLLRPLAIAAHVIVVGVVFFSHLHYSIDVVGAYAVTFTVYALFEWQRKGQEDQLESAGGRT